MRHVVDVKLFGGRSYKVHIGRGIAFRPMLPDHKIICAFDRRLKAPKFSAKAVLAPLPSGESAKTFAAFQKLIDVLIKNDDGSPMSLVAYGGGAVGDLVGFVASTYRRGIPFFQVPTTLLSMVDASVGGKTAINHPLAKNMIGTFHQPAAVIADLDRLKTLSPRQFRSGMAEVIKHAAIGDAKLLAEIEKDPGSFAAWDGTGVEIAVHRSVKFKAAIVAADERETHGIREALNFGHTLGHALESLHGYKRVLHGEAVSIGIAAALRVSRDLLGFDEAEVDRIENSLRGAGLPVRLKGESAARLMQYSRRDKKRRSGRLRMTLLEKLGKVRIVDDIDEQALRKAALEIGAR